MTSGYLRCLFPFPQITNRRSGDGTNKPAIRPAAQGQLCRHELFKYPGEATERSGAPKKRASHRDALFFGGGEGSRTPVRKYIHRSFSGRRRLFGFPRPRVSRHTHGFGSFMMHGTLKALRTHVRHLIHALKPARGPSGKDGCY